MGLVAIGEASWQAAERVVYQLWQLEQRRRDRAAIKALIARS